MDHRWLESLRKHLAPLVHQGRVRSWDRTQVGPGEDIAAKRGSQLDAAHAAVLLLSPDYLNDDLAREEGLRALRLAQDHRLDPALLLLSHCSWRSIPELARLDLIHAEPLASMDKVRADRLLQRLAEKLSLSTISSAAISVDVDAPDDRQLLQSVIRYKKILHI